MPIGNILQRVAKLVSPAGSDNKNSNAAGGGDKNSDEQQDGDEVDRSPHVGQHGDSCDDRLRSQPAGGSRLQQVPSVGRDDQHIDMKRSSAELDSNSRMESSDKGNKQAPTPIQTSHLSVANPLLSVTPATPITPASPSEQGHSGRAITFARDSGSARSSTASSPSEAQKKLKGQLQTREDHQPGAALLSEEQNRNSSLIPKGKSGTPTDQQKEGDHQNAVDTDSDSMDGNNTSSGSGIVLEEPEQMSQEQGQRLLQQENKQKREAEKHSVNGIHDPDDQRRQTVRAEEEKEEDHPNMPPPQLPNRSHPKKPSLLERLPSEVITDSPGSESPTTPHTSTPWTTTPLVSSKPYPPKPSLLNRLPSQVISESPGSEYAPSPEDGGPRSASHFHSGATFFDTPAHFLRAKGESKSDDIDEDAKFKGAQGHLPHMLASAVQDLSSKLSKPTDYGFPIQGSQDEIPEATAEEPTCQSPQSEGESPLGRITASPPSSSFLEPGHLGHQARDSRASSVKSGSSINEYSTPAGFMKHRRNSSQNAPREVKETPNAGYKDLPDGKRKLNQYVLTSDIGRGSFGIVQIAKDEETGLEYAAKEFSKLRLRKRQQSEMIRRQAKGSRRGAVPMRARTTSDRTPSDPMEASKKDLDLIRSEVAIMKKLDHPNVVKLYEVLDVQQDDSLFMIVELCREGPIMNINMGQAVEPMDEDTARNFFRQMVLAIEYLHENGIIHRDIKPENILKMSDGQSIKLVDFGVSEMFSRGEDQQRELRTGGSPAFMAPELCMTGQTKATGRAVDIWALGVTLYCMVAGHLPFESHQMLELYDKIKSEPVNMPETLSGDLKDLIVSLLEKDPSKRIQMDELREHPWVTCGGRDPLPSTEMNVTSVEEITEDDLASAIAVPSVSYIVNAVRAATRWRRFAARRTQSDSAQSEASTASADMSRSASQDVIDGLQSRRSSYSKDSIGPASYNRSSDHGDESNQEKEYLATLGSRVVNNEALKAVQGKSLGLKEKQEERMRHGSSSSQDKSSSPSGSPTIKPAQSFPLFMQGGREKKPDATPSFKKSGSLVNFPEVDRHLSQQEYLSSTGIDDSSVEMLRHYEDTTGHMLPRSAVEEIVNARNTSPMPRDRQTAKGPSPP